MASDELEKLRRLLKEREREHEQEKQRIEEERDREKQRIEQERDREKQRADKLEADQLPTTLFVYLSHVKEKLLSTFSIEPDPSKTSSGSVSSVRGKYYPRRLCLWEDFNKSHDQTFGQFIQLFLDKPLFPSKTDVLGVKRELSPTTMKDEQDIRPFVRSAIEKPAQRLVLAYLKLTQDTNTTDFFFQNNAYSLSKADPETTYDSSEDQPSPSKKGRSGQEFTGIPDRWGIRQLPNGDHITIFVGEYKAAHKVRAGTFQRVFSQLPNEDLFLDTLRRLHSPFIEEARSKDQTLVAQVLCQAFHYMITAGLKYGYVTSGEGLVLLMVDETDPQTLYYHLNPVPGSVGSSSAEDFDPRCSPASQLSTFAVLALQSEKQSAQWIRDAESQLYQWPVLPMLEETQLPFRGPLGGQDNDSSDEGNGDDAADDDYKPRSRSRKEQHLQPTERTETETENRRSSRTPRRTQRPVLPYCTQACLIGLSQNRNIDPSCPNVSLHQQGKSSIRHPISKQKLCALIKDQLDRDLDENCECLDKSGLYGQVGVLFKITLTSYGYTFVAKGVQSVHEKLLSNEASVYSHLSKLQGVAVPVHLGNIKLVYPYPLVSCAVVTSMMFMSWAGNTLHSQKHHSPDVDMEAETQRTAQELTAAGLYHHDVHGSNLVWNQEQQRVMLIDFNQASIRRSYSRQKRTFNGEEDPKQTMKRMRMGKENMENVADVEE